jgi:hypothetical protein
VLDAIAEADPPAGTVLAQLEQEPRRLASLLARDERDVEDELARSARRFDRRSDECRGGGDRVLRSLERDAARQLGSLSRERLPPAAGGPNEYESKQTVGGGKAVAIRARWAISRSIHGSTACLSAG